MKNLKKVLKNAGLTQAELAERLGVSQASVSKQLKKGIKTISTAKKYSEILKCDPFIFIDPVLLKASSSQIETLTKEAEELKREIKIVNLRLNEIYLKRKRLRLELNQAGKEE